MLIQRLKCSSRREKTNKRKLHSTLPCYVANLALGLASRSVLVITWLEGIPRHVVDAIKHCYP